MKRLPENEAIAEMEDTRRFNEMMGKRLRQHEYRRLAREAIEMDVPLGGKVMDLMVVKET